MKTFAYRKKLLTILLLLFLVALGYGVILPVLPFLPNASRWGRGPLKTASRYRSVCLPAYIHFFKWFRRCLGALFWTGISSLLLVLLFIGLAATGAAFIAPDMTTLVFLEVGPDRGNALGLQKSTDGLGQMIGPIAGSWFLRLIRICRISFPAPSLLYKHY